MYLELLLASHSTHSPEVFLEFLTNSLGNLDSQLISEEIRQLLGSQLSPQHLMVNNKTVLYDVV